MRVSAGEASRLGNWEMFCSLTGLDYYALKEGLDDSTEFELSPIGFLAVFGPDISHFVKLGGV